MRPILVAWEIVEDLWREKWFYGSKSDLGALEGTTDTQSLVVDHIGGLDVINTTLQDSQVAYTVIQPEDNRADGAGEAQLQLPVEELVYTKPPQLVADTAEGDQSDEGRKTIESTLNSKPEKWGEGTGGTEAPKATEARFADPAAQTGLQLVDDNKLADGFGEAQLQLPVEEVVQPEASLESKPTGFAAMAQAVADPGCLGSIKSMDVSEQEVQTAAYHLRTLRRLEGVKPENLLGGAAMAAWLEQHKDELMRPWLACIAKAAAAKESAAAQPQAGMAPHKPDVLADAAPHDRKGLKQQVVSMTREELSTETLIPVARAPSVQPTSSCTEEGANDAPVPGGGQVSSCMAGPGRRAPLGGDQDMPLPPGLAAPQGSLQGPMPPMPGMTRRGRGCNTTSDSFVATALKGALPAGETRPHSHGGRSQRRGAPETLPLQHNPGADALEAVPEIAAAAPPAALLAAPPAAPPAGPPVGPPPGLPGGGQVSSCVAGPGRRAALGADQDMPLPPGLAAPQGSLQGPVPPMPGMKRRGRGFTMTSDSFFATALEGALPAGDTGRHCYGGRSQRRGAPGTLPLQHNPGVDALEAVPEIAAAAPPAALRAAPPAAPPAGPPVGPPPGLPAGPPVGPPPGLPAGPPLGPPAGPSAAPHAEIHHKRPLQLLPRLKAHLKTIPRGYALMHLPEEAEEGDEETTQAILRDRQRQQQEAQQQARKQKSLARFNKRAWVRGGCTYQDLLSGKLSREQVQGKLLGALDAYAERQDSAELRDKGLLPCTEASYVVEQLPLVAIKKLRRVNCTLITEVMLHLCTGEQPTLSKPAVRSGTRAMLNTMGREGVVRHAPKAADWIGGALGALVNAGVLSLKEVAIATLQAAPRKKGEDGQLVSSGAAWKLMGAMLQVVAQNSSQAQISRQWQATGLELDAFIPSCEKDQQGKADPQRLQAMSNECPCLQIIMSRPKKGKGNSG
ncbi:hypothetical protein ABBQ38_005127 [Trebouxia sp. C0009 RCD-2024]